MTTLNDQTTQHAGRFEYRRILRVVCGATLFFAPVGVPLLWHEYQMAKARPWLRQVECNIDNRDPQWRSAHQWSEAEVPLCENSGTCVLAAGDLLPGDHHPWTWRFVPGRVLSLKEQPIRLVEAEGNLEDEDWRWLHEAVQEVPANRKLPVDVSQQLTSYLGEVQPALRESLELANLHRGAYTLIWKEDYLKQLSGRAEEAYTVTGLLGFEAIAASQLGETERAMRALQAEVNATRSLEDAPVTHLQLVRRVTLSCLVGSLERCLNQTEFSPTQLCSLQEVLQGITLAPGLVRSIRGERSCALWMFDYHGDGRLDLDRCSCLLPQEIPRTRRWYHWIVVKPRALSCKARYLELMTEILDFSESTTIAQMRAAWNAFRPRLAASRKADPEWMGFVYDWLSAIDAVTERTVDTEARLECMKAIIALERFRLDHGTWPRSLSELTPAYLSAEPVDPFTGGALRFRINSDHAIVYSVWTDEVDDGGKIEGDEEGNATDRGFRLWLPQHRGKAAAP